MRLLRPKLRNPQRVLGLVYILMVAIIWVAASFVIQAAQGAGVNVVVLTFIANSLFSVYLPIYWVTARLRSRRRAATKQAALVPMEGVPPLAGYSEDAVPKMTKRQVLKAALVVGPLWYVAQLTFNISLAHTSVTSNTVLSSTSALFTFLISMWLLREPFSLKKLGCIVLLIAGTAVYTLGDTQSGGEEAQGTLWGDLLVVASAVLYASYTVAIRKLLTDEDHASMTLFFGLSGLIILLGLGPLLLLLWTLGVDMGTLTWPSFGIVMAMGLIDNVVSDPLYARAIQLAGPTIASAGLSMQVPMAVLADAIFSRPAWLSRLGPAALTLAGAALILVGFLGKNLDNSSAEKQLQVSGEGLPDSEEEHMEVGVCIQAKGGPMYERLGSDPEDELQKGSL